MTLHLTINAQPVAAEAGQTVLAVARAAGIPIPTLCDHPALAPVGSCRLCLVEVDGQRAPVAACTLPVAAGQVVRTETPALVELRRTVLELLLQNYRDSGTDGGAAENEFRHWVRHYGLALPLAVPARPGPSVDSDPNPFIRVDWNQCILCTRCVRACAEVQGRFVWGVAGRGATTRIVAGAETSMLDARCESCGLCAAVCPTGALTDRLAWGQGTADRQVTTTCGYCGVGCQLSLHIRDERIVRVTTPPGPTVNGVALCVKGRYGYEYVHHPDRLTQPRVRRYLLDGGPRDRTAGRGAWVEVDWDTALAIVAHKLAAVRRESGPDSIGVLASAKCTNEENYLMQKFARQAIGTHNVDHCARLCHSSTVTGLAMAFGSGAMSNTMADIAEQAQALFIIGSNTTEQHPVFGARLRQAVLRRGIPLVVADPRAVDITEFATLHLRQAPGTDVALINGLMHLILAHGWEDRAFIAARCEGFAEFCATVEQYPPERVAAITGVPVADLERAAELLARHRPMAVIWAMGITQHTTGVLNVLSLANLQMLLGNMGVPGGGVNPLRGQNNVQGACDMGALPNLLPGYQPVTDGPARARFAAGWQLAGPGAGEPLFGDQPGRTVTELIPQAGTGGIRALYILGEDPVLTEPDSNHTRACLDTCEFVVLQEIFPTETAAYADVLLPGAAFAEKGGTVTNTERRVQLMRPALTPPGAARADWAITAELARRLLALTDRTPAGPHAGWAYAQPAQILEEVAALTPAYAGVNHARLAAEAALYWPVPAPDHPGTPILHTQQFTRGRGRFHAVDHLPAQELPDPNYPLLLTTGRVLYHWHGGEMTRRAPALLAVYPEALVEISPEDGARLGVADGAAVQVESRRGTLEAHAIITDRVGPGVIFANFHFPGRQNANNLTLAALDPLAKIPEYKVCAVRIVPSDR